MKHLLKTNIVYSTKWHHVFCYTPYIGILNLLAFSISWSSVKLAGVAQMIQLYMIVSFECILSLSCGAAFGFNLQKLGAIIVLQVDHHVGSGSLVIHSFWAKFAIHHSSLFLVFLSKVAIFPKYSHTLLLALSSGKSSRCSLFKSVLHLPNTLLPEASLIDSAVFLLEEADIIAIKSHAKEKE